MDEVVQGCGEIFTDPDADKMRVYFRKKSRKLQNKLTTVREAVAKFIYDGDYIAVGGFGGNRAPHALLHEILRQGRKNLGVAGHTSTHDFQILSAGECFDRCDAAYVVGLEARGMSASARRYMQSGRVKVCEWTNYSLSVRLRAAASGVSFLPMRSMLGTDTFKYSGAKMMPCPFTGAQYAFVPALYPDVGLIHVHEADIYGNCRIRGVLRSDHDLARASKRLIVTCERIIPNEEIRRDPNRTVIPCWCVDAVCEVPFGSYPGNMYDEYFSDEDHLREWLKAETDPDEFRSFLDVNVYGCRDHFDYIERNGGMHKMLALRKKEWLLAGAQE